MASERAFTRRLGRFFGSDRAVRVPIGDDAAVVANRGRESVLCCDPVVEGVHFDAAADPAKVGGKAVHRNLADLAAMGAVADWLLVSLVLPRGYPATRRRRLLSGLRAAATAGGARVVGGDVATADGPLVVTVTAIGHLPGRALLRSALRVGDALHVTGSLGGSRSGRHLTFAAPQRAGVWLARRASPVRAAIDISDGLLLDLATMLAASGGLGAELDASAVPVHRDAVRMAGGDRATALAHAFGDGEDHELLFGVPKGKQLPRGGPLSAVARRPFGRVVRTPGLWLCEGEQRRRLQAKGHEHPLAS